VPQNQPIFAVVFRPFFGRFFSLWKKLEKTRKKTFFQNPTSRKKEKSPANCFQDFLPPQVPDLQCFVWLLEKKKKVFCYSSSSSL
jgi:hypothetical protein